ncbi:hypothetical protein FNU76_04600 [Chitinimonas arctica]|uniref:Uncharacterized protein n=1 Tax=Chitinimonas arctica TaxID=2594795 RepID=A0A516SC92_9NEIS|nr:hypothetical protein [Chitinimonas arctica]QDQ25688.1 hypothetical protein FNU76_04600 [Chitinimonas arctica]
MGRLFFLALAIFSVPTFASGDPGVLYIMGTNFFLLLVAIAHIVKIDRNWEVKYRALAILAIGVAGALALLSRPGYSSNALIINCMSLGSMFLSFLIICILFKKTSHPKVLKKNTGS